MADHFSEWFPELPSSEMPSYQGYNRRLNRLSAVFAPLEEFAPLVEEALAEMDRKKR